ncbi:MAG: DUF4164 family protein [Hyphomicrobiales bacterium]|nr:DUF4164 family protein [Hyphomicrobiales bacterium]
MTEPVDTSATPAPKADFDGALARLQAALTVLEVAAARKHEADRAQADLGEALGAMQDDRARLAGDLDAALARARRLEAANSEVARRLEAAGVTLRALAGDEAGQD